MGDKVILLENTQMNNQNGFIRDLCLRWNQPIPK